MLRRESTRTASERISQLRVLCACCTCAIIDLHMTQRQLM